MADWKEHAKECEEILGNPWYVVHHWLDEYAKIYWPWMGHRVHRHHKEGIEEVRKLWGDEAAYAAEMHILKDEGKILSREEIEKRYGVIKEENNSIP